MGCMSENTPSFFKFLADDSIDYLPICPAFVDKYLKGLKYPKNPIFIKTESEEATWTVEIEEMGRKQQHCFVKGWLQFVKDNLLHTGDFLVFWLISPSVFLVAMYGPSCCEKSPNPDGKGCRRDTHERKKPKVEDSRDEDPPNSSDSAEEQEQYWFSRVVKKYNKYFMPFRRGFMTKKNGLRGKKRVVLRNEKGREWEVGIRPMQRYRPYAMTWGWFRFRKENKVEVGDTCVFSLQSTTQHEVAVANRLMIPILDVHVIRKPKRKRAGKANNVFALKT